VNADWAALVSAAMPYKRTYYNTKTPVATPIFRTVVIPTELVIGLYLAMQGEPVKLE